jgi:hypothetical protein
LGRFRLTFPEWRRKTDRDNGLIRPALRNWATSRLYHCLRKELLFIGRQIRTRVLPD